MRFKKSFIPSLAVIISLSLLNTGFYAAFAQNNSSEQTAVPSLLQPVNELEKPPTLFAAYTPNLSQGTAQAAVQNLQLLNQVNLTEIKVDLESEKVSLQSQKNLVLELDVEKDSIAQAVQVLEKTRLSLKDYIASGGQLDEVKPTQLPNKFFAIKAGEKVIFSMEDIGATTENAFDAYVAQRTQIYDMTNSIRKAYGIEPIIMKPLPDARPALSKDDILSNLTGTGRIDSGMASWYGPGFHGRRCANGERYDMNGKTAAHKKLAFGTLVKVTNQRNGKSVVVRINDRGPYAHGRIIDLSKGAASEIGLTSSGVAPVVIEVLKKAG